MRTAGDQFCATERRVVNATEFLIGVHPVRPSSLLIYSRVRAGFALTDVRAMISSSVLYARADIMKRIIGKSTRRVQQGDGARLNAHQSALAYQYAQALELAIAVFGLQPRAEAWLERPCRHLEGHVPLDMIESSVGFQAVVSYLQRIEMGVYQ